MAQGDEPMTHPDMITEALEPMLADESVKVVNLLGQISDESEFEDRNCIQIVCDHNLNALYFSREPIPIRCKIGKVPMGKQVCIIPFRRDYLIEYTNLTPTQLEIAESIDMLRILEHGEKVRTVDTPEDLVVEKLIKEL